MKAKSKLVIKVLSSTFVAVVALTQRKFVIRNAYIELWFLSFPVFSRNEPFRHIEIKVITIFSVQLKLINTFCLILPA